jgi:hypothetical protein
MAHEMKPHKNNDGALGWKMIRIRPATHALFTKLQDRRELARVKGQIFLPHHDVVTQDDVLLYLLKKEEQDRQRRKRHQNLPAGDQPKSAPIVSPAEGVYTGITVAGNESLDMEDFLSNANCCCDGLIVQPAMCDTPAINHTQI